MQSEQRGEEDMAICPKAVWEDVRKRVSNNDCDFHGMYFPVDPAGKAFAGMSFKVLGNFRDAQFDGDTNFEHTAFRSGADFTNARFSGSAFFARAKFSAPCDFSGAKFEGYARFVGACFVDQAMFAGTLFRRDAFFEGAQFQMGTGFWDADFRGGACFSDAVFKKWLSIGTARVKGTVTFSLPWDSTPPFCHAAQGEEPYRLAKRVAQEHGDYRRAADYHYAEECAINSRLRRIARKTWKRKKWCQGIKALIGTYGEVPLARWLFGYGERPLRPLIAGLIVIVLSGVFYCIGGVICTGSNAGVHVTHDWWDSLYFSVITFTTLGYGDLVPSSELLRVLAGLEALAGAALMALFIVCLVRKFAR